MNVEKIIRFLGYVMYAMLWSPVIVLSMVVFPVIYMTMLKSVPLGLQVYANALKNGIRHDMNFIKTGVW